MEKTLEDYQKIHGHLRKYCEYMVSKCTRRLAKYPDNYGEAVKIRAYQDILFKLNTENE